MGEREIDKKEEVLFEIRRTNDLPAMADTINLIKKLKEFKDSAITEIANIILKDYALTTKLLKVVNSVVYQQFGEVTTISRAIFLLGIEHIKDIAFGLMIFEHLERHGSHPIILDVVGQAFFAGFFAEKIVRDLKFIEEEEAFICSLLHPLGKILAAFSLPEKILEVQKLSEEQGISENSASIQVLGISFEEIGTTMASEWNFPDKIVQSMHNIRQKDLHSNPSADEKLAMIATLSTEVANSLSTDLSKGEKKEKIEKILNIYKDHVKVPEKLDSLIVATVQDLDQLEMELGRNLKSSSFYTQLEEWSPTSGSSRTDSDILEFKTDTLKTIDTLFPREVEENPETIFSKGITEINSSVQLPFALNDVIRIALETMFRGLKGARILRTLFLVRDTQKSIMKIRFGFGEGIEDSKVWFIIDLEEKKDVFNLSLSKFNDLVIRDTSSPEIKKFVPLWYRKKNLTALYLILLPITVNQKNIGLVCLEGEVSGFDVISKGNLNYLRILRDQIVMAIVRLASKK